MTGQVLGGRYELVDRLAAPGRRVVWTARDRRTDRTVAVQVVAGAGLTAEDGDRLVQGARAAAVLAGRPHVLAVLDAGCEDGTAYLVTEHAAGRGLDEVLAADGPPDPARAAEWARALCTALAAGHAAGLLHGDVRPSGVLVTADGTPRLMDFGVAGLLTRDQLGGSDGSLAGVPWMSPEHVRGGADADHRSDLYALGCLLYHLLAGVAPFGHREVTLQLAAHLRETPVAPGRHRAGVPAALDALVLDLLAKAPEDRPQSAADVAERLAVLAGPAGAAGAGAAPSAPAAPAGFPAFAAAATAAFGPGAAPVPAGAPAAAADLLTGHGPDAFGPDGFGSDGFGPDAFDPARRDRAPLRRAGLVAGCTALAVVLVAGLVWAVGGGSAGAGHGHPPQAAGHSAASGTDGALAAPDDPSATAGSGTAAPSDGAAPSGAASPGAPGASGSPAAPGASGGPSSPAGAGGSGAPGVSTAPSDGPSRTTTAPVPGPPPASPSTAAAAYGCSGGLVGSYPVATGAGAVFGYYYLFYDNGSGKNCAATIKTSASGYGTASAVRASISRCSNPGPAATCTTVAGTTSTDAGNFTMYAGPVRVAAAGACITGYGSITWGGVTATTAASLGNKAVHCG